LLGQPGPSRIPGITDGASNTIIVAEVRNSRVVWTDPSDLEIDQMSYQINDPSPNRLSISSYHPGGANVVFGDGRVSFLKEAITPRVLRALLTGNGGEIISADEY
jgi:prepilin-type processing-associated H-X9-DG protein